MRFFSEPAKGRNPRWHGLDKSDLIGLIDQLQAPALVMDSLNNDYSIIAVTSTVDKDSLPIIATIRCYGEGQYELATLQSNYLTSVYGRTNFSNFLDKHVKANTLLYADKEKVQRLELFSQQRLLQAYFFALDVVILCAKVLTLVKHKTPTIRHFMTICINHLWWETLLRTLCTLTILLWALILKHLNFTRRKIAAPSYGNCYSLVICGIVLRQSA